MRGVVALGIVDKVIGATGNLSFRRANTKCRAYAQQTGYRDYLTRESVSGDRRISLFRLSWFLLVPIFYSFNDVSKIKKSSDLNDLRRRFLPKPSLHSSCTVRFLKRIANPHSAVNSTLSQSGRSEAWLSRLPWAQEVLYESSRAS